jgi:hypothetical protein
LAAAWPKVVAILRTEQERLASAVAEIEAGRLSSPLADGERFDPIPGITCHAVYHAGQIQLVKRLRQARFRHRNQSAALLP